MIKYNFKKGESINRWLVTEPRKTRYYSIPEQMKGFINTGAGFILSEYPCRTQFLLENRIRRINYEHSKNYNYNLYIPFENKKIEFSDFNHFPAYISFFSKGNFYFEQEKSLKFKVGATGGLKIWINGQEQLEYTPYTRNHISYRKIEFHFKKGINEVVIFCDDLMERDINFYYEIIILESDVEVILDKKIDEKKLKRVESVLTEMFFSKDCYKDEEVKLIFPNGLEDELELEFSFESGEPVNHNRRLKGEKKINKGSDEIVLFTTEEYPICFYKITFSVSLDGEKVTRMLTMENYKENEKKIESNIVERKKYALEHIAKEGDDTLDRVLAILKTKGYTYEAEKIFEEEIQRIEGNYDCADFTIFSAVWMYKEFKEILPKTFHYRIKEALLNFRYWIDEKGNDCMWYFSENHALCLHGGELLVGELFENEIFSSGITGKEHAKRGKERLIKWFEEFFEYGLGEWNSVTYIPIDLIGFIGLFSLVKDNEIKALSKKATDYIMEILAKNFHSGITSSSYGRVYEKELKGQLTNECSFINWIIFGEGYLNNKLRASTLLALSDYVPSEEIIKLSDNSSNKKILDIQGKERVLLYSFKNKKYSISSAINYRRGELGHQESIIHINIANAPASQMWISHPGEEVPSGEGRPSYWAGNGRLPDVVQNDNWVFINYNIHSEDRVKFTHLYSDLKSFEQHKLEENKVYLRKNGVNILVMAKNNLEIVEIGPTKQREIRSYGMKNYWFTILDDNLPFEEFVDKYRNVKVREEEKNNTYNIEIIESSHKIDLGKKDIYLDGENYFHQWKGVR